MTTIGAKLNADFNALLAIVVQKKASDLFITADLPPSIKVHGRIMPASKNKLSEEDVRQMVLGAMSPAQREEFARTNECNFAIKAKDVGRFRVSAFIQRDAAGMVLRRIESKIPTVEQLGLPPIVKDLAMTKRGLVIFTGATGTGKSTSLAACLGYRNNNSTGHIVSIEDPIEFIHEHAGCIITQREVGIDTESYEVALKNTLRQAPDVILIGEIRTRAVMEDAIAFAETGHLVLSTLHANNANQALDRIINFFPDDRRDQLFMDLSMNLRGIVAQQLVRRPDGKSRQVVIEVLLNTPLAADMILKGEVYKLKDLMKRSNEQGMITFDQALYKLYKAGRISYEDAILHADSANEVRLMIKLGSNIGIERYARGMEDVSLLDDEGNM
jgi:twitching motility protein PilU